ncbi:MAG: 16S rRNA (uracil(1498)-N(3))-methyltransferase [Kiritimatiellaeota bacterium]|nr:16S rRNA (uracil(1498)-N(3))-methyltransferase [Kiritimatiellota bacterium]
MNRILFSGEGVPPGGIVMLAGTRATHILNVLRAQVGDQLKTGFINGPVGTSRVMRITNDAVWLSTCHNETAPAPWIDVILAAPRPKVMKRLWSQFAALGVGRIVVVNAFKVEKSYFHTQWVTPEHYAPLLIEGLMQSGTSQVPEVHVKERFKPFVEDELDALFPDSLRLLAHPDPDEDGATALPEPPQGRRPLLAIGPEGGWIDYELEMLTAKGFIPFSLGPRTLRTDTAAIALIATLMAK